MHLQRILTSSKENNESWQQVSVVIIDKDFTEHKVLKEEFPEAVILYCQSMLLKLFLRQYVTLILIKMTKRYSLV